jgi:hypothetical protein
VLDLFADDARTALVSQGFRVTRIGPRHGPVAFQSPLPGTRTQRRTVRLSVGYDAFDARALTACVEAAGVPTTPVRPGPGDADAPDLELLLNPGDPWAFVALYADPARARENAPSIRRNVRHFGGAVERRGRVTVAWVIRPSDELRSAVRGCTSAAAP